MRHRLQPDEVRLRLLDDLDRQHLLGDLDHRHRQDEVLQRLGDPVPDDPFPG